MMKKYRSKEKPIENSILNYLAIKRIFAWKNQSTGVFDPTRKVFRKNKNPHHINGVSDILAVYKGKFLAIEVKSPTGSLTIEQKVFLERVKEEGGLALVAKSLDDVINFLAEVEARHFGA